jgi:NADH dehydrogenase
LTRDPNRARHLTGAIDVVTGDVRDAATLEPAMKGVALAVSAIHGFAGPGRVTPASVDRDGNANLIDAASAAGAAMVLVSVVGAAADSPMELFRAKYEAEQCVRASSIPWTIVRATAFVELWAEILAKAPVFGRGDNPINFVSVEDVAALVERATVDSGLRGQVLEIGGPQNLTFNDLARMLRDLRGRPKTIRHVPRWALHAMALFARQPRAAVAMDTIDLSFDASPARGAYADLPMTDLGNVLSESPGRCS